jgi:hypothetical protein
MRSPTYFRDEMVTGAFKSYSHEHGLGFEAEGLEKDRFLRGGRRFGFLGEIAVLAYLGLQGGVLGA